MIMIPKLMIMKKRLLKLKIMVLISFLAFLLKFCLENSQCECGGEIKNSMYSLFIFDQIDFKFP